MAGKKLFFAILGLVATGLALVGVWLPGIPTTFPLIVALWAFSKSSERLYSWVGSLPVLKQALAEAERFERERTIDWRIKLVAVGSAWISTIAMTVLVRSLVVTAVVAVSALACTAFMFYVPTHRASVVSASADDEDGSAQL